jgi:hypothetical protein
LKSSSAKSIALLGLALLFVAAGVVGEDVPLRNWTVPPYHHSSSGGLTPMTDVTFGIAFVGVTPCRLVDTRQAGFPAGYGTPALVGGSPRNFDLNSDPLCTGIPAGVDAYSLNITVTNTQGPGFILIYPQGGAQPPVSTVNYVAGQTIANAAIVPAGSGGGVTVIAGVSGTDLIIDINGYFSEQFNSFNFFSVVSSYSGTGGVIFGQNQNTTVGGAGGNFEALSPINGAAGVFGTATSASGAFTFGGKFRTNSVALDAAGVKGITGLGDPLGDDTDCGPCFVAGVRGVSGGPQTTTQYGVIGISRRRGVGGVLLNTTTGTLADGYLGYWDGANAFAGRFFGNVSVSGTLSATSKPFVQPHPFDPSKEIKYIAIEGPQSEVYFRGTAQVSQGVTRIAVPEHFKYVADPATYSVLVTPVGSMATVAVLSEGEDGIVIQASRNVRVHYVVYAERSAIKNPDPIVANVHFRPETGDAGEFASLPESYRQLMIRNGTLRPDGTVNMETAQRLGWDRVMESRKHPVPAPTPE